MRRRISIDLPGELLDELDGLARAEGRSRSAIVREAVREHLFSRQIQALRRRLMPLARARGIHTDEDVFRELA